MPAGAVVTHGASIEYVFDWLQVVARRGQAGASRVGDAGVAPTGLSRPYADAVMSFCAK